MYQNFIMSNTLMYLIRLIFIPILEYIGTRLNRLIGKYHNYILTHCTKKIMTTYLIFCDRNQYK